MDSVNGSLNQLILDYLRNHEYRNMTEISEDLGVAQEFIKPAINYLCAKRKVHSLVGWNRNSKRLTYYRLATGPECSILKLLDQ